MNWTREGSLNAFIENNSIYLLSSGKYVDPIKGHELYIFPASMPETNAPNDIWQKINNKKVSGINKFNFWPTNATTLSLK